MDINNFSQQVHKEDKDHKNILEFKNFSKKLHEKEFQQEIL